MITKRCALWLAMLAVSLMPGLVLGQARPAQGKPNIVFMLVDNLGYGDIGPYGGGAVRGAPTPNLDRLAREGLQLTNFNVEPECTPTRSALITGRMPIRSGTSRVPLPGLPQGITPWEYTIAELLGDAGYQSAAYGKWHLGDIEGRYPTDQGFDEWYGFPHSSAEAVWDKAVGFDPQTTPNQGLWEGTRGSKSRRVGDYDSSMRALMDTELARRSVAYITAHARDAKPFFLYVPFSLPHSPPLANPAYASAGKTAYQNVLMEIDRHAGEIMKALDDAGIADNTIVIWASDNGPETMLTAMNRYGAQSDSGPFRGEFPSSWEGALRVPALIRWPGRIPAGSKSNEIVTMTDFYSTLAHAAGAEARIPSDRPMDSFNQLDLFAGKTDKSPREFAIYFYADNLLAVKWRNFKLHYIVNLEPASAARMSGQTSVHSTQASLDYPWIFNVEDDPKELWNVSVENAWIGVPVTKLLVQYQKSVAQFPNIKTGDAGPTAK